VERGLARRKARDTLAPAGLGIRTAADDFGVSQKEYGEARADGESAVGETRELRVSSLAEILVEGQSS